MALSYTISGFSIGFFLVIFTIPAIIRVSVSKHLYDMPNSRKVSKASIPTLGGIAIFAAFVLSTVIATSSYQFKELTYIIASLIILLFIGLKDDLMDLSARKKLVFQILASLLLIILGDIRLTNLQGALGIFEINYPTSVVFTLFVMVAVINAFNLLDGIDGLASGISIVISVVFGSWFLLAGHPEYGIMAFCLAGSLSSFFVYNVYGKRNKIFMGDSGSLILGLLMVVMAVKFIGFNTNYTGAWAIRNAPVVAVGILIVPIIDTLRVFFIRISENRSPFSPDMNHIHHTIIRLGNSHLRSSLVLILANIAFIAATLQLNKILDINNLIICLFAAGFILAYFPNILLSRQTIKQPLQERNTKPGIYRRGKNAEYKQVNRTLAKIVMEQQQKNERIDHLMNEKEIGKRKI